jgi:hypothetical protein
VAVPYVISIPQTHEKDHSIRLGRYCRPYNPRHGYFLLAGHFQPFLAIKATMAAHGHHGHEKSHGGGYKPEKKHAPAHQEHKKHEVKHHGHDSHGSDHGGESFFGSIFKKAHEKFKQVALQALKIGGIGIASTMAAPFLLSKIGIMIPFYVAANMGGVASIAYAANQYGSKDKKKGADKH